MSVHQLFTQHPGENVVFTLRRHPFTFLKPVGLFVVMLLLPFAVRDFFFGGQLPEVSSELLLIGIKLLASVYFLSIWLIFLTQFTDYYLDVDIITNDRIIDIEQTSLFGRSISELDLTRVQDVHSEIKGIIASFFNYGLVVVQTAAEHENFVFKQVPNPHGVRQRILELAALDRKREARELMTQPDSPKTSGL